MAEATELQFVPLTKVDWKSTTAYSQFRKWRKEVDRIINGPLAARTDAVKMNLIFIWGGGDAETLIDARIAEDETLKPKTPAELLDQLAACLVHSTYFREAREDFYKIVQSPGENTTSYFARIVDLHGQAEFPNGTQFMIVDKLIHGCLHDKCKRELMTKGKDATVKNCLDIMRKYEAVDVTMKKLGPQVSNPSTDQVDATYTSDRSQKPSTRVKSRPNNMEKPKARSDNAQCVWCSGESHSRDQCPAKNSRCAYCKKYGHYERACLRKKDHGKQNVRQKHKRQHAVEIGTDQPSDYEDDHDLDAVSVDALKSDKHREAFAPVVFHTKSKSPWTVKGKVDTGAMVSCMPISLLASIGMSKKHLKPSKSIVKGISGTDLKNCGTLDVDVSCNGIREKSRFYVTEYDCPFILGLEFCKKFKLVSLAPVCVQRSVTIEAVHITTESGTDYRVLKDKWRDHLPLGRKTGDPLQDLKAIFPETFDGNVGLFDGLVSLKVSPDARPTQLPPRAVPQSLMPRLKEELDKMEAEGIIRACPETTEWVHNLVTVVKKNGSLRLCLDPRNLNKYLIRNIHYTASFEDAQHSFRDGRYFSTLDAKSGYWTKQLDEASQLLTAFNTPFKKYCFKRLPFGLSVSSEVFCEHMDRVLAGIPGTFPCADDVKVQGSTEERHDINLLETVQKAHEAGLKFNPDKCCIKTHQIEYFGRIISPAGVSPCPKKVKSIANLPAPVDKQELQSLLGSVNFMATFIPNLSKKTHLMRSLLKRDVHFVWTSDMQKELDDIKQAICKATELVHYDPNKPLVIETDASLKGLGGVLMQDKKPVRYLSKALTQAEMNYSNIERELLAVLFACEKLHNYTFGRPVEIHTDHKPLELIFLKPISLAPARLQRMLLRLAQYDLRVKYVGSKSVLLADTLSRLVTPGSSSAVPGLDISIAQVLKVSQTRLALLQQETKTDLTLIQLMHYINEGWPNSMQDLPALLHPFWCFRDELVVLDGLVMKGNRVVIPASQQVQTLERLHDAHQGLTSTLRRARRTVYWPNLQDDVQKMIEQCDECQIHGDKKPRPSERQIGAVRPMEVLGMDLMEIRGKHAIVTIDFYSGFLTYDELAGTTTSAVIKVLHNIVRKFGLPEMILSDNGPCFKSEEFHTFCANLDIGHITSSPHYHQSNGRAERAISTIKKILKKTQSNIGITRAIIAYLDTPINHELPSPAELFFNGRQINTRLSMAMKFAQQNVLNDVEKNLLVEQRGKHLNKNETVTKMNYLTNQPIWFSDDNSNVWQPGYVRCQDMTTPDSYWISTQNNRTLRRNVHDLKPRFPTAPGALTPASGNGDLVTPSSISFQHCAPHVQVSPVEPKMPSSPLGASLPPIAQHVSPMTPFSPIAQHVSTVPPIPTIAQPVTPVTPNSSSAQFYQSNQENLTLAPNTPRSRNSPVTPGTPVVRHHSTPSLSSERVTPSSSAPQMVSRSGREIRPFRQPDFMYFK